MVVSLSSSSECNSQGGGNVVTVKNAFLGPNGHADFFKDCSYGRMVFDRQALTVVSTVLPCSVDIAVNCDEDMIADAAKRQLPPGVKVGSYDHHLYVFPGTSGCNKPALADIPGIKSWYPPNNFGIFSKGTVMQEILHNFGIYHGYKNLVEYEDYSSAMGKGASCPSAPELWRLGWATPLAQLNSTSLPLATYTSFTLPATYLGPKGVMIRIIPDWLGKDYTKNLYLALRVKAAGDRDLLEDFNGKLNIHEVISKYDSNLISEVNSMVNFLAAQSPNSNVNYPQYKLQLITGALVNGGTAISVKLCRFIAGPKECTEPSQRPSLFSPPKLASPPLKTPPPSRLSKPPPPAPPSKHDAPPPLDYGN
ncbi:hypothetical protein Vafri_9767 [Volvox africanus]|uniref:Peptidase M11 gametolysin domain-containing protein n=1 Tax=Volvox africanus TaxID=51714 RepID=A0A8J4B6C5_9CHLO|nr:hypothetical protein Vafri_9767 [Volvox africanus]